MAIPGLSALLGSNTCDSFLTGVWPQKHFVVHGLALSPFRDLPSLKSRKALLASWQGHVQVHLPDISDEASSIDATPSDAEKLFKNQMSLLFNNVEKQIPELKAWIEKLCADLGMPSMTYGRSIVYATPDGKGTAWHFDQNINFVLQLHGTKKWKLAYNRFVENPTVRHTLGLPMEPELQSYAQTMPTTMKDEKIVEVVLNPGSILFVPRGCWHSTEAEGEALALNFTFSQPCWADLLTAALRSRLMLSNEWRELAGGVSSSDPKVREFSQQKFDGLLLELATDLPNWQAADILSSTER
jgi:50S ribosomal protein L16 3-hydroxylase